MCVTIKIAPICAHWLFTNTNKDTHIIRRFDVENPDKRPPALVCHTGQCRQGSQFLLALACRAPTKRPLFQPLVAHLDILQATWTNCRRGTVGCHRAKLSFGDGVSIRGPFERSQACFFFRDGFQRVGVHKQRVVVVGIFMKVCTSRSPPKKQNIPKPLLLRPSKLNLRLPNAPCLMSSPVPCLMGSRPNCPLFWLPRRPTLCVVLTCVTFVETIHTVAGCILEFPFYTLSFHIQYVNVIVQHTQYRGGTSPRGGGLLVDGAALVGGGMSSPSASSFSPNSGLLEPMGFLPKLDPAMG